MRKAAIAEFERKQGLRSSLVNLAEHDDFRKPNLLGAGLYGSFALFQIDNYFVEVLVEIFNHLDQPLGAARRRDAQIFRAQSRRL